MEPVEIIALYAECISTALPFTVIFWIGEMITTTFLRAAFSGKLSFKVGG